MLTRGEMADYALQICIPLMERTEERRRSFSFSTVNDNVGYQISWIESFCRPLWGLAPILREREVYFYPNGEKTEVCGWIRRTLLEGTDPQSPWYWDRWGKLFSSPGQANQLKTELSGLLMCIYFTQEKLWDPIEKADQERIAGWIYRYTEQAYHCCYPNNHYWFCMLNFLILKRLGFCYENTDRLLEEGLSRLDDLYLGGGWYQDGDFGRFDYYNAWALNSYPLLWTLIEDSRAPGYDERKREYLDRANQFLPCYFHWFDESGCNIPFGRSLSYRFAACALFSLAALAGCEMDYGMARNAVLKNIEFFKENTQLDPQGIYAPGFLYPTTGVVENYISDGGPYWCAKAFWALWMDEDHPFWKAPLSPLPIEQGDFQIDSGSPKVNMIFSGNRKHSGVTLFNNSAQFFVNGRKNGFFHDVGCCYSKFAYNTRSGFGLSTADNVSLDNMIGLITPDRCMCSHRMGYSDEGWKNGMLISSHHPFSNDAETVIRTWVIPLENGYHARIHRISLSQPYGIAEGGFSVGFPNDSFETEILPDGIRLKSEKLCSEMYTVSDIPIHYSYREIQPGKHLFAPLAGYPCYETETPCPQGEYLIASVFRISSDVPQFSAQDPKPELKISGGKVLLDYQGTHREV